MSKSNSSENFKRHPYVRAFPWLIESDGFANQSRSDSSYLPMEVGRYVESPLH